MTKETEPLLVYSPQQPGENARRYLKEHYQDEKVAGVHTLLWQNGRFRAWDGRAYRVVELDGKDGLRSRLFLWLEHAEYKKGKTKERFNPTKQKLNAIIDMLAAIVPVDSSIEAPMWLDRSRSGHICISMRNGILDVTANELLPHSSRFYTEFSLPFDYDPEAKCPLWLKTLKAWWPETDEPVALQDMFGYLISGDTSQHKMFYIVGATRSGKGVICFVLRNLFGHNEIAAQTVHNVKTEFGKANLIGKPLAIFADARWPDRASPGIVETLLSISGEDPIPIDIKYQPLFDGRLRTRLLFTSNELPKFKDSSATIPQRLVPFRMSISFLGREDTTLKPRLEKELAGIFNWALEGLHRVAKNKKIAEPWNAEVMKSGIADYASDVKVWVREHEVQANASRWFVKLALFEDYDEWARKRKLRSISKSEFEQTLMMLFPDIEDHKPTKSGNGKDFINDLGMPRPNTWQGIWIPEHYTPDSHPEFTGLVVRQRRSGRPSARS